MRPQNLKKKRVGIWVVLLCSPIILLFLMMFTQVATRFITSGSTTDCTVQTSGISTNASLTLNADAQDLTCESSSADTGKSIVNIISLLAGISAVVCILLAPLWIILLIKALSYNSKLQAQQRSQDAGTPPQQPPQTPYGTL